MRDGNRRGITILIIIVIVAFILILGTVFFGIRSVGKILIFLVGLALVLSIIGLVFWAVWYLFIKKQKFDATYQNKKRLISAGKISKPQSVNDLYLSGDRGHSRVRIGKIVGYCRVKVMKRIVDYDKETGEPKMIERDGKKYEKSTILEEEQDIFVVERGGLISRLFGEPMVIRVRPDEHDQLVGDVTLEGFSLTPISEYYYLHQDYLDVRKTDYSILKEGERTISHEMMKDFKEITDKAIGLDSGHKKDIEKKNLYEIPALQGGTGGGN